MIATSDFLTAALECTKFDFGRGSAPDPAEGAYPRTYSWFKGPTSKERGGKVTGKEANGGREEVVEEEGIKGKRREREEEGEEGRE